ncbi:unnamed protein product [Paramecium primaurelia]|uniref:Uncharacterized protein n=1 Tax=Paramecium primaurelia TaxID=5886 RepID=A0A8S1PC72_PARPR|nr:unnamed protein product [Paramecium primaurelia]
MAKPISMLIQLYLQRVIFYLNNNLPLLLRITQPSNFISCKRKCNSSYSNY